MCAKQKAGCFFVQVVEDLGLYIYIYIFYHEAETSVDVAVPSLPHPYRTVPESCGVPCHAVLCPQFSGRNQGAVGMAGSYKYGYLGETETLAPRQVWKMQIRGGGMWKSRQLPESGTCWLLLLVLAGPASWPGPVLLA